MIRAIPYASASPFVFDVLPVQNRLCQGRIPQNLRHDCDDERNLRMQRPSFDEDWRYLGKKLGNFFVRNERKAQQRECNIHGAS